MFQKSIGASKRSFLVKYQCGVLLNMQRLNKYHDVHILYLIHPVRMTHFQTAVHTLLQWDKNNNCGQFKYNYILHRWRAGIHEKLTVHNKFFRWNLVIAVVLSIYEGGRRITISVELVCWTIWLFDWEKKEKAPWAGFRLCSYRVRSRLCGAVTESSSCGLWTEVYILAFTITNSSYM